MRTVEYQLPVSKSKRGQKLVLIHSYFILKWQKAMLLENRQRTKWTSTGLWGSRTEKIALSFVTMSWC